MGLFSRRRRYGSYGRRRRVPTIWDNLVWAVEPDTAREIVAVIFIVFGALFALGLFHLAGHFGEIFFRLAVALFGVLAYAVPFVFLYIGLRLLFLKAEFMRATSVIGIALLFFLVPAIFYNYGGSIGVGVSGVFTSILSKVGGFIALVGATIVALLLAFNASVKGLLER